MSSEDTPKCPADSYWDIRAWTCVLCSDKYKLKEGKEFSPNCGLSDNGGRDVPLHQDCREGTFNNGTFVYCQLCFPCPPSLLLSPCTRTSDTLCCREGQRVEQSECRDETQTATPENTVKPYHDITSRKPEITRKTTNTTIKTTPVSSTVTSQTPTNLTPSTKNGEALTDNSLTIVGVVAVTLLISACLFCVIYLTKKKKHPSCREIKRRLSQRSLGNHIPLADSKEHKLDITEDIKDIDNLLSPEIQAAPLHSVLNNMDVVEELVLLLDPDMAGVKNTRNLAANCSFSYAWINYVYSMRDSRSPLVAVLEKIVAKYPHWNVGHMAGLLSNIGRNDAVAVLNKLSLPAEEV